jgi:peptide/nickel transport system ATP-binding protein
MRFGELMEVGDTEQIFENPQDPYTQTLVSQMPKFSK